MCCFSIRAYYYDNQCFKPFACVSVLRSHFLNTLYHSYESYCLYLTVKSIKYECYSISCVFRRQTNTDWSLCQCSIDLMIHHTSFFLLCLLFSPPPQSNWTTFLSPTDISVSFCHSIFSITTIQMFKLLIWANIRDNNYYEAV